MNAARGHLPGCYRNLPVSLGESLAGYLLRLAEANGYAGIRDLLQVASLDDRAPVRNQLLRIYASRDSLGVLGRIAVGDEEHLQHFFAEPLSTVEVQALFRDDRRVDLDALLPARATVCPPCLADSGVLREEWDLAPVTVCGIHGTVLLDECGACRQPLSWTRTHILYCGACGADLREAVVLPASDVARAVSDDFEALAPFRLRVPPAGDYIADWDEMFKVFKALLLPDWRWALDSFPKTTVAESTLVQRHALIETLATTRAGTVYDLSHLRARAQRVFAPLRALPIANALEDAAMGFLAVTVGLSKELAVSMSRPTEPSERASAAEEFSGRPPQLEDPEQIRVFLDASADDVDRLFSLGLIKPRTNREVGYDADHLLQAREYLARLVGLEKLSTLAGVPVTANDLQPAGLLPRWNPSARQDSRVPPVRVVELQRALTVEWHRGKVPTDPVSLGELALSTDHPFAVVDAVIKSIVAGSITRIAWGPPFRWCDLKIERSEWAATLRR